MSTVENRERAKARSRIVMQYFKDNIGKPVKLNLALGKEMVTFKERKSLNNTVAVMRQNGAIIEIVRDGLDFLYIYHGMKKGFDESRLLSQNKLCWRNVDENEYKELRLFIRSVQLPFHRLPELVAA